jgi:glycosyltransferase involved in cell wall biosynthesis
MKARSVGRSVAIVMFGPADNAGRLPFGTDRGSSADRRDGALNIAMLAPPWIPVPAPGYGGIEAVIDALCLELLRLGHAVTLFAAPGSESGAIVRTLLEEPHPDEIGQAAYEADHVAQAFDEIDRAADRGTPFDVVHDHCGYTALAMANRLAVPLVHTIHGAFSADNRSFYARHARKADLVAISHTQLKDAPDAVRDAQVIPNPLDVRRWPFSARKGDHLVWLGRMTDYKGPHRAIDVARAAGRRIVLAGPIQPGQENFFAAEVEPRLVSGRAHFVGEVGGVSKQRLLADAAALLMPIRWQEPFGMVMIEALATGTPVIAFAQGAASEVVIDGENGFLVDDENEMAAAVGCLGTIDPARCRASVISRYDVRAVASRYVAAYRHATRRVRSASVAAP